jgi:hypothetical protein
MPPLRLIAFVVVAAALVTPASWVAREAEQSRRAEPTVFASRIAALSEPGGYFDTDNLISNERSYLQIAGELERLRVRGGAYLGVGPDQNFSYIAEVRPAIAIVIDIRRDNLLLHLLFKALFEVARTRVEYVALLTGRSPPAESGGGVTMTIDDIVGAVDRAPLLPVGGRTALRDRLTRTIRAYGVPLSTADEETIARFHGEFIDAGLSLQFTSTGRLPQPGYPTYRDLLREVDLAGRQRNFLASEDGFRFVQALQARHAIVPVVGDLSGSKALAAVGGFLREERQPLMAIYTSNVEFYLFRQGRFAAFMANLERLPAAPQAVVIRSVFGGGLTPPRPGYNSVSLLQPVRELVDGYARGLFRQYRDLTR